MPLTGRDVEPPTVCDQGALLSARRAGARRRTSTPGNIDSQVDPINEAVGLRAVTNSGTAKAPASGGKTRANRPDHEAHDPIGAGLIRACTFLGTARAILVGTESRALVRLAPTTLNIARITASLDFAASGQGAQPWPVLSD